MIRPWSERFRRPGPRSFPTMTQPAPAVTMRCRTLGVSMTRSPSSAVKQSTPGGATPSHGYPRRGRQPRTQPATDERVGHNPVNTPWPANPARVGRSGPDAERVNTRKRSPLPLRRCCAAGCGAFLTCALRSGDDRRRTRGGVAVAPNRPALHPARSGTRNRWWTRGRRVWSTCAGGITSGTPSSLSRMCHLVCSGLAPGSMIP